MSDVERSVKGSLDVNHNEYHKDGDLSKELSSDNSLGQGSLVDALVPHDSYEGKHRWDPTASWTPHEEAVVIRKTDFYLLTWICVMFFGLQLDRGNIQNALTDNLLGDLHMTTNDYNNGTTIQLVCFLATEFPIQLLVKRYGFKNVLPPIMMAWGTVSWTQAFMTNRAGFYISRAILGACEGGFIPATILFSTYFYTSRELSVRLAFFWSTLNVARVISSLLAAGILEMRGVGGKSGWFWLFLLEGVLTFFIGLISFFYLPVSPTYTKGLLWRHSWYSERQEIIMTNRILRDDPAKGLTSLKERATFHDILQAWRDPSMWGLYFIGLVAYIPATPVQSYLSLTLKKIGFSTFNSNVLSIPSAVLQIILMLLLARSSEFFGERTWHCFFGEFWCLPLLIALTSLPNHGDNWPRFALTTMISGYPYFHPIVSAWISENSFSVQKRAITAATYNILVQVGSLIGSQIYRASDAPYYYTGNKVLIALCVLSLVTFIVQNGFLRLLNKRKELVWSRMNDQDRRTYRENQEAREVEGNRRLDFRFRY